MHNTFLAFLQPILSCLVLRFARFILIVQVEISTNLSLNPRANSPFSGMLHLILHHSRSRLWLGSRKCFTYSPGGGTERPASSSKIIFSAEVKFWSWARCRFHRL